MGKIFLDEKLDQTRKMFQEFQGQNLIPQLNEKVEILNALIAKKNLNEKQLSKEKKVFLKYFKTFSDQNLKIQLIRQMKKVSKQNYLKKGSILIKGKTLGIWSQKKVLIDYYLEFLEIQIKQTKRIPFNSLMFQNIGKNEKEKKWMFSIQYVSKKNSKKTYMFGFEHQQTYIEWLILVGDICKNQNRIKEQDDKQLFMNDKILINKLQSNRKKIQPMQKQKIKQLLEDIQQKKGKYFDFLQWKPQIYQEKLCQLINQDGSHFIWKNQWRFDPDGSVVYLNKRVIDAQKNVLLYMIKKIGTNFVQGKSLLNITMPIDIFEQRSNLQRYANSFIFAPIFLQKAAILESPIQKMKYVIAWGLTFTLLYLGMQKPFNPILGQTYQGFIKNCPIYIQQISHHPPIASVLLIGKGYKIHCNLQSVAQLYMNSFKGTVLGRINVVFQKETISYSIPSGQITGTIIGQRKINIDGRAYCIHNIQPFFAQIKVQNFNQFNPGKVGFLQSYWRSQTSSKNFFSGSIYQINNYTMQCIREKKQNKIQDLKKNQIINELAKIEGHWVKNLEIDGQELFNLNMVPYVIYEQERPLPSHCNFREDLLLLRMQEFELSQNKKEEMQQFQRDDLRLRGKK